MWGEPEGLWGEGWISEVIGGGGLWSEPGHRQKSGNPKAACAQQTQDRKCKKAENLSLFLLPRQDSKTRNTRGSQQQTPYHSPVIKRGRGCVSWGRGAAGGHRAKGHADPSTQPRTCRGRHRASQSFALLRGAGRSLHCEPLPRHPAISRASDLCPRVTCFSRNSSSTQPRGLGGSFRNCSNNGDKPGR